MASRRSLPASFKLILICIVVVLLFLRYGRHTQVPEITCGGPCGSERWKIKTVSDEQAGDIVWTPLASSLAELVALPAPSTLDDSRADPELRVYSVEAVLLGMKAENGERGDHDFHLVLADPQDLSRTMIAEVPSGDCADACRSSHVQNFVAARQLITERLSAPAAHFRRLDPAWVVRVEGVAFFDVYHNQIGVAENCIELHPVLRIEFLRQLDPGTLLPGRIERPAEHHCGRFGRGPSMDE